MKYVLVIVAALALGSCQKSSDKKSEASPNQQQGTQAPPAQGQPAPGQPPSPTALPILNFGFDEYVYDGENEIHMELLLTKASSVPIMVDVSLVDGTAWYPRDYAGFLNGGDDLKQSVVLAPGQTRIDLPFGTWQLALRERKYAKTEKE